MPRILPAKIDSNNVVKSTLNSPLQHTTIYKSNAKYKSNCDINYCIEFSYITCNVKKQHLSIVICAMARHNPNEVCIVFKPALKRPWSPQVLNRTVNVALKRFYGVADTPDWQSPWWLIRRNFSRNVLQILLYRTVQHIKLSTFYLLLILIKLRKVAPA